MGRQYLIVKHLAMAHRLLRHKTQKKKFRYGVPALFVLQVAAVLFYIWRGKQPPVRE